MNGLLLVLLLFAGGIALFFLWWLADEAIVDVEPGKIGLLLVRGRPTDKVLEPGIHVVARLRRRTAVLYPSLEMSMRAGAVDLVTGDDEIERIAPTLATVLGDRTSCTVSYTLRFRIDRLQLRELHLRYGPAGLWSAVRDLTNSAIRKSLLRPEVGIDDLFGEGRIAVEAAIAESLAGVLSSHGFELCAFSLDAVDLGRAGDAIQAAARARLEPAREQAESEMRVERARRDAEVAAVLADVDADAALRYRETDAWRDLMAELARGPMAVPVRREPPAPARPEPSGPVERIESEEPGATA